MNAHLAQQSLLAVIDAALARGIKPQLSFAVLVGLVVAALRLHAGLTQAELSRHASLSQATLSRIESGETALDAAQAFRIAKCLGIGADDIFAIASQVANQLEKRNAHISGETPTRTQKPNVTAAQAGAAALAPIIGASLLGPIGLVIGAIVSGRALLDREDPDETE